MTIKIAIFCSTWSITTLVRIASFIDDAARNKDDYNPVKPVTYSDFFNSSYDFMITAVAFICVLSEKNHAYELGALGIVALLFFSYILSVRKKDDNRKRWGNLILIICTISGLGYFMFGIEKSNNRTTSVVAQLKESKQKDDFDNSRKICADYLSQGIQFDEEILMAQLEKTEKLESVEKQNLFGAIVEIMRGVNNFDNAKTFLKDINSPELITDRNYLLGLIDNPSTKIDENSSWIGIDKSKLKVHNSRVYLQEKAKLKILIWDASAGKKSTGTTIRGNELKKKIEKDLGYKIIVDAFPYNNLSSDAKKKIKFRYEKKFAFSSALDEQFSSELREYFKKEGIAEFGINPGTLITEKLSDFNCVVVYY